MIFAFPFCARGFVSASEMSGIGRRHAVQPSYTKCVDITAFVHINARAWIPFFMAKYRKHMIPHWIK
jgi:hypothetical protein